MFFTPLYFVSNRQHGRMPKRLPHRDKRVPQTHVTFSLALISLIILEGLYTVFVFTLSMEFLSFVR